MNTYTIAGRDALLFRDGRTFSAEEGALAAQSLPLPNPGTLAGFFRTAIGNAEGWDWAVSADRARKIAVHGPLLLHQGQPVYPKPEDLLATEKPGGKGLRWKRLIPEVGGAALCDSPDGMLPLKLETPSELGKPTDKYAYLEAEAMHAWLATGTLPSADHPILEGPERESRIHVGIDRERRAATRGKLFSTELIDFADSWAMQVQAEVPETATLPPLIPLGGERRLACLFASAAQPKCPAEIREALAKARGIRLVLTTPALFEQGWKAGWMDRGEWAGVRLKLVAAAVGRRQPLSGWSFEQGKRGPKALRWMVPAGSVYFFEVEPGSAAGLADQWLCPVSDDMQDQRDGYGLALWGVWNP